jgi:serine/threonine protein kinase
MIDQSKKYNVIKKLGEGSFGKVYLVKNIQNNVILTVN